MVGYDVGRQDIEKVINGLKEKGMTDLSKTKDLTLDVSHEILLRAF